MSSEVAHSFDALRDIAKKSAQFSVGLPAQEEVREYFSGIGFSLAGYQFIAGMGSVSELLHVPKYTVIPGVKAWVLGVSNIRGRLIPIIDLSRFFGVPSERIRSRDKRILVVEHNDMLSGLLVDHVQGMQHFEQERLKNTTSEPLSKNIVAFVDGAFNRDGKDWLVFDAKRLVSDARFTSVSLTQK